MTARLRLLPAYDTSEGPDMPAQRPCSGTTVYRDNKPWMRACDCHYGQIITTRTTLRLVTA